MIEPKEKEEMLQLATKVFYALYWVSPKAREAILRTAIRWLDDAKIPAKEKSAL